MYAVGRLSSYISQGVYTVSAPFHPFGGAVDIIVVEQPDGSFKSSPWYIKFGKFQGVLKSKEKIVNIGVNGVEADFHMYLDHKGEAYFLREVDAEEIDSTIFSPPSSGDDTDDPSGNGKVKELKNYDFNVLQPDLDSPIEFDNGKIMVRTNSRRSRIFGLFGRKSVKENKKQEEGGADTPERVSSMDRAEIAADLLDLKWSTNLSTDLPRKNMSRLPSRNTPAEELDKDSKVNDQGLSTLLVHDIIENKFDDYFVQEPTDLLKGEMDKGSVRATGNGIGETMCSNGASSSARTLRLEEHVKDTSMPGTGVLDENLEVISKTSTTTSKINLGNATVDNIEESGVPFLQNSHMGKHEAVPDTQDSVEGAFDERLWVSRAGIPNEESENLFVPCEASENSRVGVSSNRGLESLNLSQEECNEAQVHPELQCKAETLVSEVNAQLEFGELMNKGTLTNRISTSEEHSDKFQKTNPIINYEGSSVREETSNGVIESHSSFGVHLITSSSGNGEVLELIHQQTITERLCSALDYVDDSLGSGTEFLPTNITHLSNLPLESSGEDQFIFGDIDDFVESEVRCEELLIPDSLEIENNTMDEIDDMNGSSNLVHDSHSSSVNTQPCSSNIFEPRLEESITTISSPVSIPRSRKAAEGEVEWVIESLPNFRSYIDSLDMSDVRHPLSHSLDSHSENLRQELLRKEVSSSLAIDLDSDHQLAKDALTMKDTQVWEEFKNMLTNGAVDISLCKNLLYEGMGSDAASQAFDTEKLDLEKCASLGSQFTKNDNLIVRIGGRYFPWEAAESYILEMISLGRDQILEPGGMIAVDLVNKTIEGESSVANVAPGGSWALWPFGRRRSRTISPVPPALDGTSDADAMNALESSSDATPNKSPQILKEDARKKVKSIVPTTEQLAALNLKEGRNVITFTFSTAMLGKQQVDARIYLWKWNTRIVISDVDGTITRSDVLGQFMPLVGKDWSHIGVAHLFSAIKENGYQLLFLSARAISQAHLTRQFLYNLKQDGKALPDGPVVISPDGLFPSLFREVIRRAPHEFKIACLQDIRALFPPDRSPFYAGFGNRITDEISYLKLGIPKGKIFIINAKGEVAVNRRFDRKSYTSLHALVDGMFPATSSAEQEDFNSWNFWKVPLPEI
ncbi:Phosphatidate phosphatase pah2 [Thalictrum thalictroides]|uniref:phosphatidate phosphatase n=1 Tax=Thalictrum thalictroides TaxID=46969 RepID=A0A7J6W6A4_THATH|nr:Phosphatidate phosphatase pah2 [Thalictrum thalictroides]